MDTYKANDSTAGVVTMATLSYKTSATQSFSLITLLLLGILPGKIYGYL